MWYVSYDIRTDHTLNIQQNLFESRLKICKPNFMNFMQILSFKKHRINVHKNFLIHLHNFIESLTPSIKFDTNQQA